MHFPVGALPEVQNQFLDHFSNNQSAIYLLFNFFFGAFWSVFEKSKKGYPIVFLKYNFKMA